MLRVGDGGPSPEGRGDLATCACRASSLSKVSKIP